MVRSKFWSDKPKDDLTQQELKDEFLRYYFSDIAKRNNLPVTCLTPPTNSKANTYFRSINRAYVTILEQSVPFMEEFRLVLKNDFQPDCQAEVK